MTVQETSCREFAAARGWTVVDVFVDDGVSGAEFENREGFQKMLAAARNHEFTKLIVSEQKSIGREQFDTNYYIKQLSRAGVEVFEHGDKPKEGKGRSLTPHNAMEKAMSSLRGFGDEVHREDTSRRDHQAQSKKHENGYVVGGRVYGYLNEDVFNGTDAHGRPAKVGVVRKVNPEEAANVQQIFEMYANLNLGLKAIAKQLMEQGAPPPKPFVRKDPMQVRPLNHWAPSTVRCILHAKTIAACIGGIARRSATVGDSGKRRIVRKRNGSRPRCRGLCLMNCGSALGTAIARPRVGCCAFQTVGCLAVHRNMAW